MSTPFDMNDLLSCLSSEMDRIDIHVSKIRRHIPRPLVRRPTLAEMKIVIQIEQLENKLQTCYDSVARMKRYANRSHQMDDTEKEEQNIMMIQIEVQTCAKKLQEMMKELDRVHEEKELIKKKEQGQKRERDRMNYHELDELSSMMSYTMIRERSRSPLRV